MTATWADIALHLIRTGVLGPDGITRRVKADTCSCGAKVLVGLDAHRCGLVACVDPKPLTPAAEALALLCGRYTVALASDRGRLVLNARDHWHIAARPAGTLDVFASHVCGTRPAWPTAPRVLTPATAATIAEECPF